MPVDAYEPSAAVRAVVQNANEQLLKQCMAGFGFDWPVREDTAQAEQQLYRYEPRQLFGVSDLATAEQYGYHLPPSDPNSAQNPNNDKAAARSSAAADGQSSGALPDAEVLVLGGPDGLADTGSTLAPSKSYNGKTIPKGGCGGQAARGIWPKGQPPDDVADNIRGAAIIQSADDSRVAAVITKWQSCMAQSGYHIKRDGKEIAPLAASAAFIIDGPVTQAEITQAVADVRCKQSTNLINVGLTVESAYENAGIQQNIQQLKAQQDAWDAAGRKAAGILGVPVPQ